MRKANWSPMALLVAFVALVLAGAAFAYSTDGAAPVAGAAKATEKTIDVTLGDLFIKPSRISVEEGAGVLRVTNEGALSHDLVVEGTAKRTALLVLQERAALDLRDLPSGSYRIFCDVPGHAEAGMVGTLSVSGGGNGQAPAPLAVAHDHSEEEITARTKAFPATTEGTGAQLLTPEVFPDGVKQFTLTARIVQWEVESGKRVEAWTYNGTVPAPTIAVGDGDRVRVVLVNELPQPTSIHFHGIRTPNSQDGVPDVTQPAVKPGETWIYEFVARGPAVGMYHSHHHSATQVPNGLLGAFIIGRLPLPGNVTPSQEFPMVLNDAGTIGLSLNGKSFPATAPVVAARGENVLVHYMNEGLQAHPMHLHGQVQKVVAKDGFPLAQPYDADTVLVSPGERYSVLVLADEPGVWAWHCHILTHVENESGMFGMVTAMVVT